MYQALCNQDALISLIFPNDRVSVSLYVGCNIVEMLFFGAIFFRMNDPALPGSIRCSADTFFFVSCFHHGLLNFDRNSITGKIQNIRIPVHKISNHMQAAAQRDGNTHFQSVGPVFEAKFALHFSHKIVRNIESEPGALQMLCVAAALKLFF